MITIGLHGRRPRGLVIANGRLGVLYARDALKYLLDEVRGEERILKEYIMGLTRALGEVVRRSRTVD